MLTIIVILLIVVVLQRFIYSKRTFHSFEYSCRFDESEVTEGDRLRLIETVTNKKILPLPWLRSELTTSKWLEYAGSQSLVSDDTRFVSSFFMMRSYQRTVRSWNVNCTKRGVYTIEKCNLLSTDLFGLIEISRPIKVSAEVTVLPKPVDLTENFETAQRLSGDVIVKRHYIDDPFYIAGIREYTPRDPISRINWPATAKTGKLMAHNNQYTADQNLLVILNMQSRSIENLVVADEDVVENAIRICAGFFEDTLRSGIPVRFAVNTGLDNQREGTVSNEYYGAEHVFDLMRLLAKLPMKATDDFHIFLNIVCSDIKASDIVIVTATLTEKIFDFARMKQEKGAKIKIVSPKSISDEYPPSDIQIFGYTAKEGIV